MATVNPPLPLGSILASAGKGKTILDDQGNDTVGNLFADPTLPTAAQAIIVQSVHLSSDDQVDYFAIFLNGVKRGVVRAK